MQYLVFLNHWFLIVGAFLYVPAGLLFLYVITGLRSKFDPLFKDVGGAKGEVGLFFWSAGLRSTNYAGCIAYPTLLGKKHKYLFKLYQGYDFRKDCNRVQIILAWVCITFGILGLLLGVVIHIPLSWLLDVPAFPAN